MKNVLGLMLLAGCMYAQNSDLGLLLGVSPASSMVQFGPGDRHPNFRHGGRSRPDHYAAQLREYRAGRLYLELPLLIGGHASGT